MFKYYDISVFYHPRKTNIIVHAQSCMIMGSVSHLYEAKKNLEMEVHRFARFVVRLESSPDGGAIVHQNSKSSLVIEGKSKQHLHHALMDLKESVIGKFNESFSLGGGSFKVPREILYYRYRWV